MGVKFDKVIMNPPYGKDLPVNILRKVKDISKDIVILCPDTKFTTITESDYKSKQLFPFIKDYECVDKLIGDDAFNIRLATNLGIFTLSDYPCNKFTIKFGEFEELYKRIHNVKNWRQSCKVDGVKEFSVPMQGDSGFYKGMGLNHRGLIHGNCSSRLYFLNQTQLDNFMSSLDTWVYKLIFILDGCNAVPAHSPFMSDTINPRTGLLGYDSTWIDDDFYELFDVDNDLKEKIAKLVKGD